MTASRSRWTLIALLGAFVAPVILAWLALTGNWFNKGVTNQGQLLNPGLTLASLGIASEQLQPGWQLIAVLPACQKQRCEHLLYVLEQSHKALGKEQQRVAMTVLSGGALPLPAGARQLPLPAGLKDEAVPSLLIADPLGNLVLRYENFADRDSAIAEGRKVLLDLRKLLKLSKVG